MSNPSVKKSLLFIWQVSKAYKYWYICLCLAPIFAGINFALNNYAIKTIIDTISGETISYKAFIYPFSIFILIEVFSRFFWSLHDYSEYKIMGRIDKDVTLKTYTYLQNHSHTYFQNHLSGSLVSKVKSISKSFHTFWDQISHSILENISVIICNTIIIGFLSIKLLMPIIFVMIVLGIFGYVQSKPNSIYGFKIESNSHFVMGIISDKITNIFTILSFATKKRELNEIQNYYDKIQTPLINKANYYNFISWLTLGTLYSATYLVVFLYAIYLRKQGIVSTGVLVVCILMVLRCCHEVYCLVNNYKSFRNNLAELEASLNGIFIPQNPIDTKNAKALQISKGEIEFKNISFDYGEDGNAVIKNLNLKIKAGEKVGIVGHSGAGKSTLISLLLKNFKVTAGDIIIDGQSIYDVSSDSLRSQIALIPQDTALFHRSIGDNIGYAKDSPSKEEIILAAKMANIHDFIDSLPNKYETLVGERGVKLSGGQRQRIAIARAILKNAPILILDEATSSLDSQTENQIQQALSNLIDAKSKTVIAIAHRLSTLKHLDRIIVLENGKIAEEGNHEELIQIESSLYKKLWDSQVDCNLIK